MRGRRELECGVGCRCVVRCRFCVGRRKRRRTVEKRRAKADGVRTVVVVTEVEGRRR